MKLTRSILKRIISERVKRHIRLEAEEEANPSATDAAAPVAPAAAGAAPAATAPAANAAAPSGSAAPPATDAAAAPVGVPIKFNLGKVKNYNPNAKFLSDAGVVKSVNKKGIIVTTQPDQVDVLVNFDDISENIKRFFNATKKKRNGTR